MNVKGYYLSLIVVVIIKDVKDIRLRDIFDIFFCLIKVYLFIRGPPYQFRF